MPYILKNGRRPVRLVQRAGSRLLLPQVVGRPQDESLRSPPAEGLNHDDADLVGDSPHDGGAGSYSRCV